MTRRTLAFLSLASLLNHVQSLQASNIAATRSNSALSSTATVALTTSAPTPTAVSSTGTNFPPVGSVKKDFSPAGLQRLWDIVGPVEAPPFTTTRIPQTPIPMPSPPPPMYPSWFAPAPSEVLPDLKLPKDFLFGVATAAYQVEGAVKNEGKGPTMWDWNSRQPGGVVDNTTGDIVDLQYYLYKEDVSRVAALGINAHSFSISWARIFPFGTADSPVNKAGLDHYSDLIDYHIAHGVTPVATLFHWDAPIAIQAYYGGFTSPKVVDDFVNYAKTVFKAYNGRVKTWYTFNEPRVYCGQVGGYPFNASLTPGVTAATAPYHARTRRSSQRQDRSLMSFSAGPDNHNFLAFRELGIQGEISFKNDDFVGIPWRANNTDDLAAVERHAAFRIGVFSNPAFTTGDWPKIMTDTLPPSFLPRLSAQDKKDALGSADFFAIDPYRTQFVRAPEDGIQACVSNTSHPLWPECHEVVLVDTNGWAAGLSPDPLSETWLQATPNLFRQSMKDLHTRWPAKKMYVSEFGFVEPFEELRTEMFRITEDVARTNYFMSYLGEVLLSIHEDKIPIAGTFAWAMIDNAEWGSGLSAKFGVQHVNYTTLERTYKRSAFALSDFFKAHKQS
ncbi:hypothetical protein D9619_010217 [Psilocybe cf. subviscida]|uniref:Glycoside hydrolase family 1 protein n=1 Tax=Psilocybe cf. subviscida TaxID=2480587 RepID=A0A8H5ASM5_9AGAR|nr:hypothetical protein D9619_010217 [Psilocybe cf. subviscida]